MFYRQKIVLGMLELNDGVLGRTDLQKLLFLFCQETGKNFYDFFPHQYGSFSLISYHDRRKLVETGHLKDGTDFELKKKVPIEQLKLKRKDYLALHAFSARYSKLRGRALVRDTYLKYPAYASRSSIVKEVLSPTEYEQVSSFWNQDRSPTLFTIGYEGSTIDDYLYRLILNNVRLLIDVRKNPFSRKHGFSAKTLKSYLKKADIGYVHIPELGIPSSLRKNLDDVDDYHTLFEHYANEILPLQQDAIARIKELTNEYERVALTCFEAEHCMCHRHKVAEKLEEDVEFSVPVKHI